MDFCFFLIGFKEFNKPLPDIGNIPCYCGHCHNQSAFAVRTINCVTLFFIPVLPFYYQKRLKCNICGTTGGLDATAMDRMKLGQPVAIGWGATGNFSVFFFAKVNSWNKVSKIKNLQDSIKRIWLSIVLLMCSGFDSSQMK